MSTIEILATDSATKRPLPAADVGIFLVEQLPEGRAREAHATRHRGVTDAAGLCTIHADVPAGQRLRVAAFVRAAGHAEWRGPGQRRGRREPEAHGPTLGAGETVRLEAALDRGPTIRGLVTDAEGRPVEGASIGLVASGPTFCSWPHAVQVAPGAQWPPPVRTDARGEFEWLSLPLEIVRAAPSVHFVLLLGHDDFVPGMVHRVETLPQDDVGVISVSVRLERGGSLDGRVVDASGHPVAAATVSATPAPLPDQPVCVNFRRDVSTDADGRFVLKGLRRGRHDLRAEAATCAPWTGSVEPSSGADHLPDVVLSSGCDLLGRVVGRSGDPAPDVEVFATIRDGGGFRRTRTDADGRFRIEGLPPAGRVEVRTSLLTATEVDLPSPPITVGAPASCDLRVRLVAQESGAPIVEEQAVVLAFGPGFSTGLTERGPDGCLQCPGLPAGRYTLRAHVRDRAEGTGEVVLRAEGLSEPVVVRVPRGGGARGRVLDRRGAPIRGVRVEVFESGRSPFLRVSTTDALGEYEVRGLGAWCYLVFTAPALALHAAVLRDTKTADDPVRVDVLLDEGATVTGRVTRSDGAPCGRVNVKVARRDLHPVPYELPAVLTDESGRFRLEHVPEGEFVLCAGTARSPIRAGHGANIECSLVL